jgi:imidazolonepropionase
MISFQLKGMALLIRGARQLLTLRGPAGPRRGSALRELGLIPDGALLVREGVIEELGSSRRVENLAAARGAEEIDATGRVVMPGFVDSHTFLVSGAPLLKEYEDRIAGIAAGGVTKAWKTTAHAIQSTTASRLEARGRLLADSMIRHGTTTCEAESGFGGDSTGELKTLRALAHLNGQPLDVESTFLAIPPVPDAGVEFDLLGLRLLPVVRKRRLARFVAVSPDGLPGGVGRATRVLEAARATGFLLKAHAEQFRRTGFVRTAVRMGAASVDHLDWVAEEDAAALAGSNTIATVLPAAAFHGGEERYAPARMLVDAGAALALASGFSPPTSPTLSMQMVVSLACSRMGLTAAEALAAATINGAYALRRAGRVGSLEVGKSADLIMLDVADYREIPYLFGVNSVRLTIKRGVVVWRQSGPGP